MEKLRSDELFSIALYLDLPDILNLCSINTQMYKKIYKKDYIWLEKLNRDFPDNELNLDSKELYILLWNLRDLKNQLDLDKDIYTLYSLKSLYLSNRNLTKLPSSIRFLSNLEVLDVMGNKLKELPNNLPDSLRYMYVSDNQIKELPNRLPSSLRLLYASHNQLQELPNSLPCFLNILDVSYNQIKKFPDNLPNYLQKLFAFQNQIKKFPNTFPDSLKELHISYNRVKENEINRIKSLYPQLFLMF